MDLTDFDRLYVRREPDRRLREIMAQWLGYGRSIRWISLASSPGRGNTTLLKQLERIELKDDHLRAVYPDFSIFYPLSKLLEEHSSKL